MDANSRMSKNSKNGNAVNMAFDGNQMAYLTNFQMPPPPPPPQHYPAYFYPEPQDQSMVPVAAGPIVQPDQYMDWTGHDDQFQLARAAVAAIPMPQTPRKIRPIQCVSPLPSSYTCKMLTRTCSPSECDSKTDSPRPEPSRGPPWGWRAGPVAQEEIRPGFVLSGGQECQPEKERDGG